MYMYTEREGENDKTETCCSDEEEEEEEESENEVVEEGEMEEAVFYLSRTILLRPPKGLQPS